MQIYVARRVRRRWIRPKEKYRHTLQKLHTFIPSVQALVIVFLPLAGWLACWLLWRIKLYCMRNLNESLGLIPWDFVPGQLAGCQSVAADPPDWTELRKPKHGVNYSIWKHLEFCNNYSRNGIWQIPSKLLTNYVTQNKLTRPDKFCQRFFKHTLCKSLLWQSQSLANKLKIKLK